MCTYLLRARVLDAILSFTRLNLARAVHNVMPCGKIHRPRVSSCEDKTVSRNLGNRPECSIDGIWENLLELSGETIHGKRKEETSFRLNIIERILGERKSNFNKFISLIYSRCYQRTLKTIKLICFKFILFVSSSISQTSVNRTNGKSLTKSQKEIAESIARNAGVLLQFAIILFRCR